MDMQNVRSLAKKAAELPFEPGVYIMKDKSGSVIYVGKAKSLKNRVSSYFRSVDKHTPKVYRMVENAADFSYIVTDSEFEALVLECSLIKQHSPKYNILLKDDKGYHYIKITPGPWPRITAEKQRVEEKGAVYIGPYTSSFVVKQTVDETNHAFMLPTCTRRFPEEFRKGRPCLNMHIKQCMGVCTGRMSQSEYDDTIDQAVQFMKGMSAQASENLQSLMERAAENLEFEKAARYRDRIKALRRITEQQKVVYSNVKEQDVIGVMRDADRACVVVLRFSDNRLTDKDEYIIPQPDELSALRAEFLTSYYSPGKHVPKVVALDGECEDVELISEMLSHREGKKITITVPQRSQGAALINMARNNAAQQLAMNANTGGRDIAALDELARLLGLAAPPRFIEAYDISNIGSQTVVGGMVAFEDARPARKYYRKFTIKTVEGTDDYACMCEVLRRRFERQKQGDKGFERMPELILIDGGRGHISVTGALLRDIGVDVPVFGMVKDDRHRTRAIAADDREIVINATRGAFSLVSKIQDEVHRFTISFSRERHKKSSLELSLSTVDGIGPARAKALFTRYKTVKAISAASSEELAQTPGVSKTAALAVHRHFHPEEAGEG